ncbi:smad nuclear interacting protein 1-like [Ruditapes philippinarum]|uniref:smad nuclear interacting protein 1-like n=1 Tax=Ruditapes philippinarum TaxID=129788 RepID=UPI00295B0A18|nr:smad nuclear interacting protein 1-like [Ruditapes philippinarum]
MVKERYRKYSSSDNDIDERKKHHGRHRSRSPEVSYKRHRKHHRHRSRSESLEEVERHRVKVKEEPVSSDSESHRRHRKHTKRERVTDIERNHGRHHGEHREHRNKQEGMVRVKQEPDSEEEMRHQRAERRHNDQQRRNNRQKREHLSEHQRYGRQDQSDNAATNEAAESKDQPNFELSGKLTEDTNTYKGVVIKYNEPPEARKAKKRWRLYPFKNDEALKPFHMHRQSAYLFGRDRIIADIPVDHPSCSKQHAVYQYRMIPYEKEDGRKAHKICPYIIDLDSANGTFVNNKKIEPRRYVELMEKDVLKFGFSSREYVLLHDKSNTAEVESGDSS